MALVLPFYLLELLVGAVQALVFALLTAVFTALMCEHHEDEGSLSPGRKLWWSEHARTVWAII